MSDPTPPPRYSVGDRSPDGAWQWNGQQWVATGQLQQAAAQGLMYGPSQAGAAYPAYVPAAASGPSHVGRYIALGCGVALALLILLIVLITIGVKRTVDTAQGNQNCSPGPCGEDGGLQVSVTALNRAVPPPEHFPAPEAGNHVVQVSLTFTSDADGTRTASPLDFSLLDSNGVAHNLTITGGPDCRPFSGSDLTKGARLGPKTLCFDAGGDPNGKLTLVWRPGSHDIDIDLTAAKGR